MLYLLQSNLLHLDAGEASMAIDQATNRIKKGRGPTTCKDLWIKLPTAKKLIIEINDAGQPIGENAYKLSSFLGTLARNGAYAPINYEDWRLMPENYKERIWKIVEVSAIG